MFMGRRDVFFAALILPMTALAERVEHSVPKAVNGVSSGDVLQWMLALLLVLVIFGLLVWLLRKTGSLSLINNRQLAVVAGLSLGMREKLVLVKVGEKQLLLGVTAGRIDKLLELDGEQRLFLDRDSQLESGLFAKTLTQWMQGQRDG